MVTPHTFELVPFLITLGVGLSGLLISVYINVFFLRRIAVRFEFFSRSYLMNNKPYGVVLQYLISITLLVIVQIVIIIFWGIVLLSLSLVRDPMQAIIFAGSCYTTIGIVSDVMPAGWQFMAILIALSGLFAIALATASMISMGPLYRKAWYLVHAKNLMAYAQHMHVDLPPDLFSIEETIQLKANFKKPASSDNPPDKAS